MFDKNFDAYATAITRGVMAALGELYKVAGTQSAGLYMVQIGAFSNKTNAEILLRDVRNMGLQAFLVEPGKCEGIIERSAKNFCLCRPF